MLEIVRCAECEILLGIVRLELLVGLALVLVQLSRDEAQDILLQLRIFSERGETVLNDFIQEICNVRHTRHTGLLYCSSRICTIL